MKQLLSELQAEFGDIVECSISPLTNSIYIVPSLKHDSFSQCDILKIIQYCLSHNLYFSFDSNQGIFVIYDSKVSAIISKNK